MKKIYTLICFGLSLMSYACYAQSPANPEGLWMGILPMELTGHDVHVVFNIENKDNTYKAVMHDPDNMSMDNKATITIDDSIRINVSKWQLTFTGKQKNDTIIEGIYSQMGYVKPLKLIKQKNPLLFERPQTPNWKEANYRQEVAYIKNPNAKGVELSGVFSKPLQGDKFPVAILIHGSGQLDRDETIAGHKIFYVISDYLASKGIAVFRYDKRGAGSSTGNPITATSEDYASDVEAVIDYLNTREDVDKQKIGLIGHSEGGIISFMLGGKRKDISYIISMAGVAVPGKELYGTQAESFAKAYNIPDSIQEKNKKSTKKMQEIIDTVPFDSIMKNMDHYVDLLIPEKDKDKQFIRIGIMRGLFSSALPWAKFLRSYDPTDNMKRITCPVLAINGEKDIQVIADENLPLIESLIKEGGNTDVTIKKYPDLNHLFQHCTTGRMDEYAWIEETISPEVLEDMYSWISEKVK